MTVAAEPFHCVVWEDNGFSLMSRVIGDDATDVRQADISTITWKLFDKEARTVVVDSGSLTVSSVIFDTLQTDARWKADSEGYNFRWDVPETLLPTGDTDYRIELKYTTDTAIVFHDVFEPSTRDLYSS